MIKQFIRDEKRKPFGVMVALDKYHIGISICNQKDKWNKKLGEKIAIGRAKKNNDSWFDLILKLESNPKVLDKYDMFILNQLIFFVKKVPRYFKENN